MGNLSTTTRHPRGVFSSLPAISAKLEQPKTYNVAFYTQGIKKRICTAQAQHKAFEHPFDSLCASTSLLVARANRGFSLPFPCPESAVMRIKEERQEFEERFQEAFYRRHTQTMLLRISRHRGGCQHLDTTDDFCEQIESDSDNLEDSREPEIFFLEPLN